MTETTPDTSERPYGPIAAELVADAVALFGFVRARRPEIVALPGVLHVTLDATTGEIVVSLATPTETERGAGQRHIIVERISADPQRPDKFGMSVLPIAVPEGPRH